MNWDDLRYFLAVCREASVSGAGRVLGVNHTTVARRIVALEKSLGTRLFDRTPDGYLMTQAAENMFDNAVGMEVQAQAIDRDTFGRDAALSGKLRVTVPYDFATPVIMPELCRFRREYPQIDLEFLTTTMLMDLAAREADLAVRLTAKPPEYLVGRKVLPLRHGVYGTRAILKKPEQADVILFSHGEDRPEWVREHFPKARTALKTDSVSTMLAAVRSGLGVARMPCYIGDAEARVRRLDVELTPSDWGVWVLSHVDLRSTARVRVCRAFMIDTVERHRALILGEASRYA